MSALSASAVSAALRRGGLNPLGSGTPRSREGLRVSQSRGVVLVVADLDSLADARALLVEAIEALVDVGYVLDVGGSTDSAIARVTGRTVDEIGAAQS